MINVKLIQSLVLLEYIFLLPCYASESNIMMRHRPVEMGVLMPLVAVGHARCSDCQHVVQSRDVTCCSHYRLRFENLVPYE